MPLSQGADHQSGIPAGAGAQRLRPREGALIEHEGGEFGIAGVVPRGADSMTKSPPSLPTMMVFPLASAGSKRRLRQSAWKLLSETLGHLAVSQVLPASVEPSTPLRRPARITVSRWVGCAPMRRLRAADSPCR